eukprot:6108858-Prymnesium_polylepis.2
MKSPSLALSAWPTASPIARPHLSIGVKTQPIESAISSSCSIETGAIAPGASGTIAVDPVDRVHVASGSAAIAVVAPGKIPVPNGWSRNYARISTVGIQTSLARFVRTGSGSGARLESRSRKSMLQ